MRRHRGSRTRLLVALIMSGALAVVAGCTGQPSAQNSTVSATNSNFVVSYAAAADRLTGLTSDDGLDQIRDWTLVGLAAHLGLDTAALRDATYDSFPVRDTGLTDLGRVPTGPGRSLYDGKGVLHLLVPNGDPHESRTIGLLLDQYRTDAGADAAQVQVHHYQIDTTSRSVLVTDGAVTPAARARAGNGYVTMRVDNVSQLTDFLNRTSSLSQVELRGAQIWASGWNWPVGAGARVDIADVSALQRGYASSSNSLRPGFSLDPQQVKTSADLLAVVPGLSPDLAQRIVGNDWAGSGVSSSDVDQIVEEQLFNNDVPTSELTQAGLPTDRTQLWALDSELLGKPAYSQARYDGDLAGTAVGMTLFYTDFETKNWSSGVGSGVPGTTVPGFVPDDLAVTPWSECTPDDTKPDESGRLWFGEDPSAVTFSANGINLGATATQLFFRSDGANGAEIQPSYSFGRGLSWWEQHQQEVADYEPQYARLDNIMRWSDVLDWMVNKTSAALPRLPDDQIPSNLRFADWYAHNGNLKERGPIDFVTPPSASQESVAHQPTRAFQDCGSPIIEGGVSLGDIIDREGGNSYDPTLSPAIRRAGLVESGSVFDDGKGTLDTMSDTVDDTGHVTDQLQHTFTTKGDTATIKSTGDGRTNDHYGALKILRPATAKRTVEVDQTAGAGQISEHVSLDGQDVGTLAASSYGGLVTIRWRSGLVDRVRTVLGAIQDRLTANPAGGIPSAAGDVLASYQGSDGRTLYDVSGTDAPFLWITDKPPPPGDEPMFQFGEPDPDPHGPVADLLVGVLVPHPALNGPHWLAGATDGSGKTTVQITGTSPDENSQPVRVTTSDNKNSKIYLAGDSALAPVDPVFARPEGQALLRNYPEINQAMTDARTAKDGLFRGIELGDGVALVGADQIFIAGMTDQWAFAVAHATEQASGHVLIKLVSNQALWVDNTSPGHPSNTYQTDAGQLFGGPGRSIYLNESYRSGLTVHPGPMLAFVLPADARVTVREYRTSNTQNNPATQAEIRTAGGGSFWRWDDPPNPPVVVGRPPAATASAPPTPTTIAGTPTGTTTGTAPATTGVILLVCPANSSAQGCQP